MAYDKHTWISGETITATELNDMESGIENNSERLDELTETVNKNTTDIDGKLDKSSVTSSLTSTSTTDALSASAGKTLKDTLNNYVLYKSVHLDNQTINANSAGNITIPITVDSGYTFLGIVRAFTTNTWVMCGNAFRSDSDNVTVAVRNSYTSAITTSIYVTYILVKT